MSRTNGMRAGPRIVSEKGKPYRITTATLQGAPARAENYLEAMTAWHEEVMPHLEKFIDGPDEDRYDEEFNRRLGRLLRQWQLPTGIWLPTDAFSQAKKLDALCWIDDWAAGTLDDFSALYHGRMDEDMDLDMTYVLYGVPIMELSEADQGRLYALGERYGRRALARLAA
jgi:hypothetical protein